MRMIRIALMTAAIGLFRALPVLAAASPVSLGENTLHCAESGAVGFRWDIQGNVAQGAFQKESFTVQVVSETERIIQWPGMPLLHYNCTKSTGGYHCSAEGGDIEFPIIFGKDGFTRAFLYGPPVGGDPNIYVSYGVCLKK